MTDEAKKGIVNCPVCGEEVDIPEDCEAGGTLYCGECEEELEIIRVEPMRLKRVTELVNEFDEEYDEDFERNFYREDSEDRE